MLGKLWTLVVPVGSIAFRMSLFSAVCAAAAAAGLYLLGRQLGLSALSALFSALLLGFSPSFWSQANIQRVYSLNALFVVHGPRSLQSAWYQRREPKLLVAAFFRGRPGRRQPHLHGDLSGDCSCGLSLVTDPGVLRRPRLLFASAGAIGIGLAPYLYLPLRSRADPRLDWGNPETLRATLDVILRREAWERAWIEAPSDLLAIAADSSDCDR